MKHEARVAKSEKVLKIHTGSNTSWKFTLFLFFYAKQEVETLGKNGG